MLSSPDVVASPGADLIVGRRIKECCVHIHSNIQKWKDLSNRGFDLANQLTNSTLEKKYTQDASHYGSLNTMLPTLASNLGSKMIEKREKVYLKLKAVEKELLQIVDKVGSLVGNLRRAVDLSLIKNQNPEEPLFSTLPPSSFVTYSEELYCAYSQEMSLRESIIGDLLTQTDRDTLTVYLSSWLHEPYITCTINEHLEAMLFECGLRT